MTKEESAIWRSLRAEDPDAVDEFSRIRLLRKLLRVHDTDAQADAARRILDKYYTPRIGD